MTWLALSITGKQGYYEITDTHEHLDPEIVYLSIDGEVVETTPEHPFYVVETNEWSSYLSAGKWIDGGDLQVGDDEGLGVCVEFCGRGRVCGDGVVVVVPEEEYVWPGGCGECRACQNDEKRARTEECVTIPGESFASAHTFHEKIPSLGGRWPRTLSPK